MGRNRIDRIYLAVTPDEKQQPLYEATTIEELAEWAKIKPSTVRYYISKDCSGKTNGFKCISLSREEYRNKYLVEPTVAPVRKELKERRPMVPHKRSLYMAVTADEYELPVYVCDNLRQLADWAGLKYSTLGGYIGRGIEGKKTGCRCYRVDLEDDIDDGNESSANMGES